MPLESDLKLDYTKFDPKSITPRTQQVNDAAIRMMKGGPRWYQVGAEKYRQMRWNGETPLPKPVVIESGKNTSVPSREKGRSIPCRAFVPSSGAAKGVFYHIHGGGWVLQSELFQDAYLKWLADECQLAVLSVGYRLAPEDPYPAGNEDCFDVGEWLVDHAEEAYGGPLLFMGGDSAGAHLSAVTAFHLLKSRPRFAFKGLVLNFGAYDLSGFLPQMHHFDVPLILDLDIMDKYVEVYCPNTTISQRQDPWISPFYADLTKMKLPPALFTAGTMDCLCDDSVMMSAKWMMSGAEAILKVYPGAPHGFVLFPRDGTEETEKSLSDIKVFLTDRL